VYSKFRKNKIPKKVKSPISMRNGRFNSSKCRGKLQKMGVLYTHSPKSPGPFPKLPKKIKFKKIKIDCIESGVSWQPAVARRLYTGARASVCAIFFYILLPSFFCACRQLFLIGSSTCPPCPKFT
jgi:hypothetical protein